jgi:hypothetical protein
LEMLIKDLLADAVEIKYLPLKHAMIKKMQ